MKSKKWLGVFARRSPAEPKQASVAAQTPVNRDDDAPAPNASAAPAEMPPPESDGIVDETSLEAFFDADPDAPAAPAAPADERLDAAEQAGSALLKAVFLARLRAQAVTCRLRLESLENRPPDDRERRLAQIQERVMNQLTANVEAAYQGALACHEEVIRFLTRLAAGDEASRAAKIRDALIRNAATADAEAFLSECGEGGEGGQGGRKQAAKAALRGKK